MILDRRALPRFFPRLIIPGRIVSGSTSQVAVLRDACLGGVRLYTPRPLSAGDLVLLELPGVEVLPGRVVYVWKDGDGIWVEGCRLIIPFAPQDLARLTT
jgi:hypothetical protein